MQLEDIYRPPQADLEPPAPAQALPLAPFFQTSPLKVALLSVATLGLYQLYWFYKQWSRRKELGEDVIPVLRTIFAVWFMYSLCQSVNREVEQRSGPGPSFAGLAHEPLNAGGLAFGFFGVTLLRRLLPVPASFLGLLSFLPLVVVQRRINQLHGDLGYDPREGSSYTLGTIAVLALGGLWWLLVGISLFLPSQ